MRLIHTSDWHLGRTLHGENLLPAQDGFLRWLLDEAVRQQAGAVVVAGDVYDRAVPPVDAVRLLDATLLVVRHVVPGPLHRIANSVGLGTLSLSTEEELMEIQEQAYAHEEGGGHRHGSSGMIFHAERVAARRRW